MQFESCENVIPGRSHPDPSRFSGVGRDLARLLKLLQAKPAGKTPPPAEATGIRNDALQEIAQGIQTA